MRDGEGETRRSVLVGGRSLRMALSWVLLSRGHLRRVAWGLRGGTRVASHDLFPVASIMHGTLTVETRLWKH